MVTEDPAEKSQIGPLSHRAPHSLNNFEGLPQDPPHREQILLVVCISTPALVSKTELLNLAYLIYHGAKLLSAQERARG